MRRCLVCSYEVPPAIYIVKDEVELSLRHPTVFSIIPPLTMKRICGIIASEYEAIGGAKCLIYGNRKIGRILGGKATS